MRTNRLPPLPSLRAFEAVGRLQSFRAASEELCVSQSAVSYHVKSLEDHLGVRLFVRQPQVISFTQEGSSYYSSVRQAFQVLRDGASSLHPSSSADLKVSVLPSFAANWLAPRLPQFRASHPHIHLTLEPTLGLADLSRGDADAAIRYGRGDWPDVHCRRLLPERICPVASRALTALAEPVRTPQDLLRHTLLQVSRPYEWEMWAARVGLNLDGARMLQLADYNIVVQAASDGLGVAMGRQLLLGSRLQSGALLQLFDTWFAPEGLGYWICMPSRNASKAAGAFAEWLQMQAALA